MNLSLLRREGRELRNDLIVKQGRVSLDSTGEAHHPKPPAQQWIASFLKHVASQIRLHPHLLDQLQRERLSVDCPLLRNVAGVDARDASHVQSISAALRAYSERLGKHL